MARLDPIPHPDDPWSLSQLFTIRVWYEQLDAEQREVRMQVRHVLSGETRFLRDWAAVAAYMMSKLDSPSAL